MDEETKNRIADYFDPEELLVFINGGFQKYITTRDLLEAFPEDFEELLDEIEEEMGVSRD